MGGNEIDAAPDIAIVIIEHIAGTAQAAGQISGLKIVAFPKTAHRIAVFVIPFGPAGRESADLIAADADIPRLGN